MTYIHQLTTFFSSPIGNLLITSDGQVVISVCWATESPKAVISTAKDTILQQTIAELSAYFEGKLKQFSVPVNLSGTPLQKAVWQVMCEIPYGKTMTYGEVAQRLHTSPRVVGNACGANPIPIIVPCHRIVAANGKLGGYSGADGAETKRWLLKLEGFPLPMGEAARSEQASPPRRRRVRARTAPLSEAGEGC